MGRFVAGDALFIFVFANVPSSGAHPAQFVPVPFKWLHRRVIGCGVISLLDHNVYDVGPGISRGVWTLVAYAAVGVAVALSAIPTPRGARSAGRPRPPSGGMPATVQQQLEQHRP